MGGNNRDLKGTHLPSAPALRCRCTVSSVDVGHASVCLLPPLHTPLVDVVSGVLPSAVQFPLMSGVFGAQFAVCLRQVYGLSGLRVVCVAHCECCTWG